MRRGGKRREPGEWWGRRVTVPCSCRSFVTSLTRHVPSPYHLSSSRRDRPEAGAEDRRRDGSERRERTTRRRAEDPTDGRGRHDGTAPRFFRRLRGSSCRVSSGPATDRPAPRSLGSRYALSSFTRTGPATGRPGRCAGEVSGKEPSTSRHIRSSRLPSPPVPFGSLRG